MSQRVAYRGKVKPLGEAEGKPSPNGANSRGVQTRSQLSYPWPG
jgi:hypothetical protein